MKHSDRNKTTSAPLLLTCGIAHAFPGGPVDHWAPSIFLVSNFLPCTSCHAGALVLILLELTCEPSAPEQGAGGAP